MKFIFPLLVFVSSFAHGQINRLGFHILSCTDTQSSTGVEIDVRGKSATEFQGTAEVRVKGLNSQGEIVVVDFFKGASVIDMALPINDSKKAYLTDLSIDLGKDGFFQYQGNQQDSLSMVKSTLSNFNVPSKKIKCEYVFKSPRPISGGN